MPGEALLGLPSKSYGGEFCELCSDGIPSRDCTGVSSSKFINWASFDLTLFTLPRSLELLLKFWKLMVSSFVSFLLFPFSLFFCIFSWILVILSERNCSSPYGVEGSRISLLISSTLSFIFLFCLVYFLTSSLGAIYASSFYEELLMLKFLVLLLLT